MSAKIKIQLGEAAFKAARSSFGRRQYAEAIKNWQASLGYNFETVQSQKGIRLAQAALEPSKKPSKKSRSKPSAASVAASSTTAASAQAAAPPPAQAVNPEEAMVHYRRGLVAIRGKDYHVALEELNIAYQLDSTNEHIYVARQRAQQEWAAANTPEGAAP